jgi:hypothetical protein
VTESLGIAVLSRGHSYGVAAPVSGRIVSLHPDDGLRGISFSPMDRPLLPGRFRNGDAYQRYENQHRSR